MNLPIKGSELEGRRDYSLSYWKDNTFVLFGGKFKTLSSNEEIPAFGVQLLEVDEEDCKPLAPQLTSLNVFRSNLIHGKASQLREKGKYKESCPDLQR